MKYFIEMIKLSCSNDKFVIFLLVVIIKCFIVWFESDDVGKQMFTEQIEFCRHIIYVYAALTLRLVMSSVNEKC